ncbi:myotubularin-related protein 3 isoform X1 [Gigaspora margarita]|uniref:Myotubularin-related protein 3 isoform X1 n=1 Tax=Gigaspora margarita TaxID=4874 RepID=A0A8H4ACF6_GIGMA|nr:myotubularin-related protein 3 isoform X1 [Gigaspora margarita]
MDSNQSKFSHVPGLKMGFDLESAKLAIPQGLCLLPGETIEFIAKTCAIKLFETTADGGFKECDDGIGEFYSQSDGAANESTVLITNYRTCYRPVRNSTNFPKSSLHPQIDMMRSITQIPHLSISQIEESQAQITISLKFSPSKYLFKFSKPKPTALVGNYINIRTTANSLCNDFSTIMKRFVYPNSLECTFAFHMGEAEVFKKIDSIKRDQNSQRSRKLSLEEKIFEELFGGLSSDEEDDDDVIRKGLDESVFKRTRDLGWSKGCIASINDDFSVSPTYPQDFILPTQLLKETLTNLNSSSTYSNLSNASIETQPTVSSQATSDSQSGSAFFENLAKFRSRGRFPVICWKKGHNVLMRSGQPMVGFLGSRGLEDETLMREVLSTVDEEHQILAATRISKGYDGDDLNNNNNNNRFSKHYGGFYEPCGMKLCVLDARGYAAAFTNGCQGGGYENIENYPQNTTLQFLGLSNIHTISASHSALLRAITTNASSPNWFSVLKATGWLDHVADLLRSAGGKDGVVGKLVDEDASVLVHCTDGWDRTTQLVSLAQIMVDPFYRTIKGLQVLIEKEWIAIGHPFRSRSDLPYNICNNDPRSKIKQTSRNIKEPQNLETAPAPVFLLFLTCLHHILEQFPSAFEYNDFFLLCLARAAAGNSPFGDFLCNSECEREAIQLRERTRSIWSWVKERKQWFRNPLYQRIRPYDLIHHNDHSTWSDHSWKKDVLRPDTDARVITLWSDYYFPKNDLSIALLSMPYGADVELEEGIGPSQHHIGGFPSEYYLVSLFMKRKRRRIAEKVWTIWRSFLLENRQKSIKSKKDRKKFVNEEEKWDVLRGSEWKYDVLNQLQETQETQDRSNLDHPNKNLDKTSILSQQSTCEKSDSLLSTDYDDDTDELDEDTNIILSGEMCESQFLEWVHLSSQGSEDSETTRILAELLREAQLDEHLCQSIICQDNDSLTELLKEAKSENQVFCQNIHSNTEELTELLKEAQLDNHYLCRSRCSNTSSINRNSNSTSNFTFKTPNPHSIIIENNTPSNEKDFVGIVPSPEPLRSINKNSPDLSEYEFVLV